MYRFVNMTKEFASTIAYDWKYDGIYSFYDMTADKEDLEEFLKEKNWKDTYYAVLNENKELIGYYSYTFKDGMMWIGFGLKPKLTGGGLGESFVRAGIDFGLEKFNYKEDFIMLAVAKFNLRAIKVYERIGFKKINEYIQRTNGGEYPFINMKKKI